MLALRARVFVVEQACSYLDVDGADRRAWHLLGRDPAGVLMAYLRVLDPGVKFDEPTARTLPARTSRSKASSSLVPVRLRRMPIA